MHTPAHKHTHASPHINSHSVTLQTESLDRGFHTTHAHSHIHTYKLTRQTHTHTKHTHTHRYRPNRWTVACIHGFFEQKRVACHGRAITLSLLSRRSRRFAGMLKVITFLIVCFVCLFCHVTDVQSRCTIHTHTYTHAGTRYLKRGISDEGYSANAVESEQIVFVRDRGHHTEGSYSSHVQVSQRVSICVC
jgi:hypothetical protein